MLILSLLLVPTCLGAPLGGPETDFQDEEACPRTYCRVSAGTLDSALETFLCMKKDDIKGLREKEKKVVLAQKIAPHLKMDDVSSVEDDLAEMDTARLVPLANLVLHAHGGDHDLTETVEPKTEGEYIRALSEGLASSTSLHPALLRRANPIVLGILNCQVKLLSKLYSLGLGAQRSGRTLDGLVTQKKMSDVLKAHSRSSNNLNGRDYISQIAPQKLDKIWQNCLEDPQPGPWLSAITVPGFFLESICPTFSTPGDEMPYENFITGHRLKLIHSVGAVGRVEWRSSGTHPYTGVFEGASHGIARLSLASKPNPLKMTTIPGMGLKFLRDGLDSANLVAMFSLSGQESWNFFKNSFTNHVPSDMTNPAGPLIAGRFASATRHIQQVGLSDWGRYGEDGQERSNPVFPFRLRFEPTGEITFADAYTRPFTEDLTSIRAGTTLYRVFAVDKPTELGGEEVEIGQLVLVSDMVISKWADKRLFFRHQNMEDDLAVRPEWREYTPKFTGVPLGSSGCS